MLVGVLVDWTSEFDAWMDRLDERVEAGDPTAKLQQEIVFAQFEYLQQLTAAPAADVQSLMRVRQSRHNVIWRVSHPFHHGVAMRLIVWFPPERPDEVVIVLFAANKAQMGDVFYDSAGTRADAAIASYQMTR